MLCEREQANSSRTPNKSRISLKKWAFSRSSSSFVLTAAASTVTPTLRAFSRAHYLSSRLRLWRRSLASLLKVLWLFCGSFFLSQDPSEAVSSIRRVSRNHWPLADPHSPLLASRAAEEAAEPFLTARALSLPLRRHRTRALSHLSSGGGIVSPIIVDARAPVSKK